MTNPMTTLVVFGTLVILIAVVIGFISLAVQSIRRNRKGHVKQMLPTAQEVVDQLSDDVRNSIENFLKIKCDVSELKKGDIPIIAMLSKVSSEHWETVTEYIRTGHEFGSAASYVGMMGRCGGFDELLEAFSWAERRYADHGFIPIEIELFESWAGYCNVRQVIAAMGKENTKLEPVVLYTSVYQKVFSSQSYPKNNFIRKTIEIGESQTGSYEQPAPEKAFKNMSPDKKSEMMYSPSFRN